MSFFTYSLITTLSVAGTLGTVSSEIETLESDVARAQNERDALALKPGVSKSDPAVVAKSAELEEKKKALQERLKEMNTRPPAKVRNESELRIDADLADGGKADDPNDRDDDSRGRPAPSPPKAGNSAGTSGSRTEAVTKEEVVLSGEGMAKEITYPKKKKGKIKEVKSVEAEPEVAPTLPGEGGISEIRYPKKTGNLKKKLEPALNEP